MAYFIIDESHKILKKCGSHKKAVAANVEIPGEVITEGRYIKLYNEVVLPPKPTEEEKKESKVEEKKKTMEEVKADVYAKAKEKQKKYKKERDEIYGKIPEKENPQMTQLTARADVQKRVQEAGGKLYGIVQHPSGQCYGIYTVVAK